MNFPDFAVTLDDLHSDHPQIHLSTFNPDADEDGVGRDYGTRIFEGGNIVGDGTHAGFDLNQIRRIASLLEHAPDLFMLLERLSNEHDGPPDLERWRTLGRKALASIAAGELKYDR